MKRDSHVLTDKEFEAFLMSRGVLTRTGLVLVAKSPISGKLRYSWPSVKGYLTEYCADGNDCESSVYELDCTHFICHALNKTNVFVKEPSTACKSNLCIRVDDLAASFFNSVSQYSNVKKLGSHADTKEGDYCFVTGWFGSKDHVMVLAGTATSDGAKVWGHTNNRCGQSVEFDGEDCVYYRIEDAG